ncbi:DUF397 domain-containing protein [Stackebrandtia soli]|uniref:DUF397 domain-containing protein n=1 Tax=Stackebrandtia soli TaxID=1892856 RepID=UPI0039EA4FC1
MPCQEQPSIAPLARTPIMWRKSSRSGNGDNCVEVGCIHDAPWRKSSRSNGNGGSSCVEVAPISALIAVRDSKLDTSGDFPFLAVEGGDWAGLVAAIRSGEFDG